MWFASSETNLLIETVPARMRAQPDQATSPAAASPDPHVTHWQR